MQRVLLKSNFLILKTSLKILVHSELDTGLDVGAKFLGKYISSILPYNEDFELLAFLGMIDPDRIHQLTTRKKLLIFLMIKEGKQLRKT